jgi:VanZ family protein
MKRIIDWLTHWDKDKVLHFALCLIIALVAAVIVKICGGDAFKVLAGGWFAGFIAGIVKEIYDEVKYKGSDSADWAADIIGTTVGTLMAFILVL